MSNPDSGSLLDVAARMFAALGYDGTTMTMIADGAGVDVESLRERTGGKTELYRSVMRRSYEAQHRLISDTLEGLPPGADGISALLDASFDHAVAHPEHLLMWMHRWLGDAADVPQIEEMFSDPLVDLVDPTMQEVVPGDVDLSYLMFTMAWCLAGFLAAGSRMSFGAQPSEVPIDARRREDFRAYLHTLVRRMTAPE